MRGFIEKINKYVILLIVSSIFGMSWFYFSYLIFKDYRPDSIINYIPTIVDYLIRLIVIVFLIIDFKKNDLKNVLITCIGALFYPLLGIVIFSILLIENERKKANA